MLLCKHLCISVSLSLWKLGFKETIRAPPVSCAGELIDVLKVLELSEDMEGVSLEAGLCTSREGQELTDLAFKIDKKIQLSAPTRQLFPRTFG